MPRPADPANKAQQERQRRYRDRLGNGGVPEDTPVDRAVAAAVTAYSTHLLTTGAMTPEAKAFIDGIVSSSVRILVSRGYSNTAARRIALRRLTRHQSARKQAALMREAGLSSKIPSDVGRGS